jgi:uncharacterized DUF497 family protein
MPPRARGICHCADSILSSLRWYSQAPTSSVDDTRRDYGERRVVALGLADAIPLTVVFTDRVGQGGVMRRIISARLSNRKERRRYAEILEASRPEDDAD